MIKCYVNTTRNKEHTKEASAHWVFSSKQEWSDFTEWAVFFGLLPKHFGNENFACNEKQCKQDLFYHGLKFNFGGYYFGFYVNTLLDK